MDENKVGAPIVRAGNQSTFIPALAQNSLPAPGESSKAAPEQMAELPPDVQEIVDEGILAARRNIGLRQYIALKRLAS